MNTSSVHTQDGVFKRVLLLYGFFMLLSNAAFLVGYYLLPEGFLRGSPMQAGASAVAATTTFWSQVGSTFLFNISGPDCGVRVVESIPIQGLPSWIPWADHFGQYQVGWLQVQTRFSCPI